MRTGYSRWKNPAELAVIAVLGLIALLIRLYYVRTAVVDHPVRGDAVQYLAYAMNLLNHHTFSIALPDAATHAPDSFRDPGYSTFLAIIASITGMGQAFYETLLDAQAVLGAVTAALYGVMVRRWISFGWAVVAAALLALWPHSISMGGYILSETLMGFLVAASLWTLDTALRSGKSWQGALAGLAFACAALTNAVVLPFAPLAGAWMLWRDGARRHFWGVFLIGVLVPAMAWGVRSMALPAGQSSGDRVAMNFVQGAWPEYHPEYIRSFQGDPKAVGDMAAIDAEYRLLRSDRSQGLAAIGHRLGSDPVHYLGWYLSKPIELWGWNIGIGQGDIYVFPTDNSPLTAGTFLRATTGLCFFINPFVMLLAVAGLVLAIVGRRQTPAGLILAAALGCFVTAVFGVLQSDARYAVPFRGIEVALAMLSLAAAAKRLRVIREPDSGVTDGRSAS